MLLPLTGKSKKQQTMKREAAHAIGLLQKPESNYSIRDYVSCPKGEAQLLHVQSPKAFRAVGVNGKEFDLETQDIWFTITETEYQKAVQEYKELRGV